MVPGNHHELITVRLASVASSRFDLIMKMDHHCVWVNNCVGAKNGKFFLQFVVVAFIYNLTFCLVALLGFVNCLGLYGPRQLIYLASIQPKQEVGFGQ
jgi:hypothetical protein